MKLYITDPSYYEKYYIVDDEITKMCEEIKEFADKNKYSDIIKTVGIVPIVAPPEIVEQGLWTEYIMLSKSIGRISVFKNIDYEKYMNGSVEQRKKLTIKCILEAIWMIKKRRGTKFDAKQFETDLLKFTNYSKEELESV